MGDSRVTSDGDQATTPPLLDKSGETGGDNSRNFRNDKEDHLEKMSDYKTYVKVDNLA